MFYSLRTWSYSIGLGFITTIVDESSHLICEGNIYMHHDQSTHLPPLSSKVLFYSAANMSDVIVCKFTHYFHKTNK